MATFGQVLEKTQEETRVSAFDRVRRGYITALHELTKRNVVVYYSGWLQKQGPEFFTSVQINDEDKHGFMAAFAGLEFSAGLDLVLHTPGGDVAATESIIDYIRSKFRRDIRVIVPQISMSGGTMIALVANEILMGLHSNLGPIDPQIGGRPSIAILDEFNRARAEIDEDPKRALLWQPILQQYTPTLLSQADQAIKWTREIGLKTLREGLFADDADPEAKARELVEFLISHDLHRAHGRHLHRTELKQRGLNITELESDDDLQDAVLSVHHACMLTVGNTPAAKLIENHKGVAHMKLIGQQQLQLLPMMPHQPMPMPIMPRPVPPMPTMPPVAPAPAQPEPAPATQRQPEATALALARRGKAPARSVKKKATAKSGKARAPSVRKKATAKSGKRDRR